MENFEASYVPGVVQGIWDYTMTAVDALTFMDFRFTRFH